MLQEIVSPGPSCIAGRRSAFRSGAFERQDFRLLLRSAAFVGQCPSIDGGHGVMIAHAPGRSRDREWSFCRADLPDQGFRNRDLQARLRLFDFPQAVAA